MTDTAPPLDVIVAIADDVRFVGTTLVGEEHRAGVEAAPRFVWIPAEDRIERPTRHGADPPSLADCTSGWTVEIVAEGYAHAWRMRQALLTSLRVQSQGSYTMTRGVWSKPTPTLAGYLLSQSVSFVVPIPQARIPTVAGDPVVDDVQMTARPVRLATRATPTR